ncbi:cytochrome P450 [Spinellus fusiger]|nr:cytochrome P450 [Spinellus fusiger]
MSLYFGVVHINQPLNIKEYINKSVFFNQLNLLFYIPSMSSIFFSFLQSQSYLASFLREYPLQSVGVVTGAVLCAIYSSAKDKEADGFDKLPMPSERYPYLGHLPYLGKNTSFKLYEWHKKLGPLLHIKMGVQDFLFVSDPNIAHEIFTVNGSITTLRPSNKFNDHFYNVNKCGITFAGTKSKLKESRAALTSYVSTRIIDQLHEPIQFETNYLIDQLMNHGSIAERIDPLSLLTFRSFNIMSRICLGTRFESLDDPTFVKFIDINRLSMEYQGMSENIDSYIPILKYINYIRDNDRKKRDFTNNLRTPVLKQLIVNSIEKDEDCIVKRMRNSKDSINYDDEDMLTILSDVMIGGTDTLSVTLSRAFFFLSHHPEVQKKICKEIDVFIAKHKRLPIFTERENFPYTIAVQREIMRLYPTSPYGIPHIAEQDFVVNNYMIKKGTTLVSDMYSIHRNPDIYLDPEKFIPERFITNNSKFYASAIGKPTERDQFNFGWGRRICPGIYLAETEMFLTYVDLWACCTIEPALDFKGKPLYADI